jgi:hypothetical protein
LPRSPISEGAHDCESASTEMPWSLSFSKASDSSANDLGHLGQGNKDRFMSDS